MSGRGGVGGGLRGDVVKQVCGTTNVPNRKTVTSEGRGAVAAGVSVSEESLAAMAASQQRRPRGPV